MNQEGKAPLPSGAKARIVAALSGTASEAAEKSYLQAFLYQGTTPQAAEKVEKPYPSRTKVGS
jgi:hypothetical protein